MTALTNGSAWKTVDIRVARAATDEVVKETAGISSNTVAMRLKIGRWLWQSWNGTAPRGSKSPLDWRQLLRCLYKPVQRIDSSAKLPAVAGHITVR